MSMCVCSQTKAPVGLARCPWTAAPVGCDNADGGSSAASDVKGDGAQNCVYDLYVLQEDQGASDPVGWGSCPEVQVGSVHISTSS